MSELLVEYRPIADLKPRSNNPRTHSDKQIAQIAASIKRFGFTNPVLIDDGDAIIAGHGRVDAAHQLGIKTVPTIRLSAMSEAEVRAYVIADNRLAENAGWDRDLLAIEFQYLSALDLDLDVTITGFDLPEIDVIIGDYEAGQAEPDDAADQVPDVSDGPAITRAGDIWVMGDHRLICASALDDASYQALLGDGRAAMVFTDPPYNVPIAGHVSGLGKVQHREFAMASGEMSSEAFASFLEQALAAMAHASADGALHYVCMDWRHMGDLMGAGERVYSELKNLCVWAKTNGGMGSLYRSRHELVFVFKAGKGPHINNVELGRHGRYRTNVWEYAGGNSFGAGRDDLALHPTVKPVALVADAIRDASHRGDIVLDGFAGSGSTLVAAARTGRRGMGIELDPHYCDVIVRRMQAVCGLEARLDGDGRTFAEIEAERLAPDSGKEAA